jgi:CRISP-associated protein Cas1
LTSTPTCYPECRSRPSLVSCRNRHASHPVNAILNYAYAVLEIQVRIATVSYGLDPTIGYLHAPVLGEWHSCMT